LQEMQKALKKKKKDDQPLAADWMEGWEVRNIGTGKAGKLAIHEDG
jgi:hypothetical protein